MLLNFPPRAASITNAAQSSAWTSSRPTSQARTEYRVRASARLSLDAGPTKAPGALGMRVNDLSVVLRLHHDDKTFWGVVSGAADLETVSTTTPTSALSRTENSRSVGLSAYAWGTGEKTWTMPDLCSRPVPTIEPRFVAHFA